MIGATSRQFLLEQMFPFIITLLCLRQHCPRVEQNAGNTLTQQEIVLVHLYQSTSHPHQMISCLRVEATLFLLLYFLSGSASSMECTDAMRAQRCQMELNRTAQMSAEMFKHMQEATIKLQAHAPVLCSTGSGFRNASIYNQAFGSFYIRGMRKELCLSGWLGSRK